MGEESGTQAASWMLQARMKRAAMPSSPVSQPGDTWRMDQCRKRSVRSIASFPLQVCRARGVAHHDAPGAQGLELPAAELAVAALDGAQLAASNQAGVDSLLGQDGNEGIH